MENVRQSLSLEEFINQGYAFGGGDGSDDDKGGKGEEDSKISLDVDGKSVEKTLDELKDIAEGALSDKDETFTLKIDGEDKTFTLDELKLQASESAGAQQKFEEAAKIRDKAASGTRIQELLESMKSDKAPDTAKVTEFLRLAGVKDADMGDILATIKSDKGKDADKGGKGKEDDEPITLENLDPRVRAAVEAAESADLKQIRERIEGETKKSVDNDKILGKIIDEITEDDHQKKMKDVLYGMMLDDVRGRILGREPYGPDMIQSSLQKVRARVQNLGIPSKSTGQPPLEGELGLAAATTPEIRATEPIKRVSSTEPGYEENAVKRVQQLTFKAAKKLGRI